MGLMDKIKNIFAEEVEEDDEIKVEQIKKEVRSVPIESPSVEKKTEIVKEEIVAPEPEEEDVIPLEEKAKTPVFFTDRDFEDLVAPKKRSEKYEKKEPAVAVEEKRVEEGVVKPYGGHYTSTTIVKKDKNNFRPTPIISPVYGILDKNYHKEDIVDKNESVPYISADGLSVDSIRNKAYGTLEDDLEDAIAAKPIHREEEVDDNIDLFDELENTEILELAKKEKKPEKNVHQIEGVTIDLTKELDNLLMKKDKPTKNKLNTVETEAKKKNDKELSESELFELIDSMYEEGEEEQ